MARETSLLRRLTNPESRDRQQLRVPLPPPEALQACREAIEQIGWSVQTSDPQKHRMTAIEDFTKINCGDSPLRLEIELEPGKGGRGTAVNVEAIVPGVGGVASKHLHIGMRAFALSLLRRVQASSQELDS